MILYKLLKNTNKMMEGAYGKYYAYPVIKETINIDGLASALATRNTGFSEGQVKGMLADMVGVIRELVLGGVAVKIEGLAIFSLGIINKMGADDKANFTVNGNIESVKLRARATGEFTRENLNKEANLADIEKIANIKLEDTGGDDTTSSGTSGGNTSTDAGKDSDSTSQGGGSSTQGSTGSSDSDYE